MRDIFIYQAKNGQIELNVNLSDETVWLSLKQMTALFGRDKSVISRHLNSIFKTEELDAQAVVAKYATTAADGKVYQVDHYNLDAIISVGYRVNSKEGVCFRQWATGVLKQHLIQGFTLKEKRLAERGLDDLQQAVQLLEKTLVSHELVSDIGRETIQVILEYAKTWRVLLAYDEERLMLPKPLQSSQVIDSILSYMLAKQAIEQLKQTLVAQQEASDLFGRERDKSLESILQNLEQTFDGEPLYVSFEEKAAHLLYFVIKDHPFSDGNKRIGCFLFLLYLKSNQFNIKLNDNGLIALALLIAESAPQQKDLMIRLVTTLLSNN